MDKTNYKHDPYTQEEMDVIMSLINEGHTASKISELTGRSPGAINTLAYKIRRGMMKPSPKKEDKPATQVNEVKPTVNPKEMSPRDMIKKLYDMGYRIEDNHLVCYVKQMVKLSDIIQ